jgi:hypothetical protein
MPNTAHLAFALVDAAQAQKEVTVNSAFYRIDAILNAGAKDKDLATPPGSPVEGDVYIIAASPSGAWAGQAGKVTYYNNLAWKFITPLEGLTLWVNDEDIQYSYNGTTWVQTLGATTLNMQDNLVQRPELRDWSETKQNVTAVASSTIDLTLGNVILLSQAVSITTLAFSNSSPTNRCMTVTLIRQHDATANVYTIAWPASVKWPASTAPTLTQTANSTDIFMFQTVDAGTKWYGTTLGLNYPV